MTIAPTKRPYDPLDVAAYSFWDQPAEGRDAVWRELRRERPISWHRPIEGGMMAPENDGVWVVTTQELIKEVSLNPAIFCSGEGTMFEEVPPDVNEAAASFLGMDAPRHGQLRRLVSSAFTPRRVEQIHAQVKVQAREIVDHLIEVGEGDFVDLVSKRLPMWTINELLGFDAQQRQEAASWANELVSWADEDVAAGREPGEVLNDALIALLRLGYDFAEKRRRAPANDLMTGLVQAEVDGQKLTDDEIASFFVLLSVAGNDTTRHTISLTARALQQFPEQRALLLEDYAGRIDVAMDEFVRWATPVMTFRRTATRDTVLGGQEIKEGEWVAMVFSSGNRDERVYADPDVFDITRNPNPHVGFGAGGPHFCMGQFLAKMQIREIFDQLLHRVPTMELGEPTYLTGNFVRAVRSMPVVIR
ncbi:cytochrome P450 [Nocardioides humilatus]|uniref:Cytochrome P450 n=1 Tax=Nocardioides humilatus TaxID=2607660 RepID=A0A5B1L8D8_9ACTN|nr:cytochrome P450 [Nocardioides humilatus]KAA1416953.1 cytochrome P450 [Nocardioides humilatus]